MHADQYVRSLHLFVGDWMTKTPHVLMGMKRDASRGRPCVRQAAYSWLAICSLGLGNYPLLVLPKVTSQAMTIYMHSPGAQRSQHRKAGQGSWNTAAKFSGHRQFSTSLARARPLASLALTGNVLGSSTGELQNYRKVPEQWLLLWRP